MAGNKLSHAEVWDDEALISSWNEALDEYKYYHSLHVRGEQVEDLIDDVDDNDHHAHRDQSMKDGTDKSSHMIAKADLTETGASMQNRSTVPAASSGGSCVQNATDMQAENDQPHFVPSFMAVPQMLIAQGSDEALKNLMMSWYYAGYYTGLHEGQQQKIQTESQP